MVIALHLGAHKTATTYIQKALEQSQAALGDVGVGYAPLTDVRRRLTRSLDFGGLGLRFGIRTLLKEHRAARRLILSDENILGGLMPGRATGLFYPEHRKRVALLTRSFGQGPVQIYLATRSYDEFISSMYCEYIRHNRFIRPDAYLAAVDVRSICWSDLVASFVSLVGARNLCIWRYEDFATLEDHVFQRLTDGHGALVQRPDQPLRPSLSAEAVTKLGHLPSPRNRTRRRLLVKRIAAENPKGADVPGFSAFAAAEAADLRQRYEAEIRQMPRQYPGVTLLGADPL